MPYYKIMIWLKNGKVNTGVRHYEQYNIDVVYTMIKNKLKNHYKEHEIKEVDVYMLSKHSREIKKEIIAMLFLAYFYALPCQCIQDVYAPGNPYILIHSQSSCRSCCGHRPAGL